MFIESIIIHLSVQKYKQLFLRKKEIIFLEEWKRYIACKSKNVSILKRFGRFLCSNIFWALIFFIFFYSGSRHAHRRSSHGV